jgi:N-methylhydantoinase B
MTKFDPVSLGIMWDRLISITDEILIALVSTSFSTNVRESYDLSVVLFDPSGSSLAQGTYSVPSFTGTAPETMRHMLERFPPHTLQPGDVIVTNDPWLGTGHLFDINVMRPVFKKNQLVGFTMSITHLPDIGGRGFSATATEVYEEGLRLPICKLSKAGKLNEELLELIKTNVRVPEQTVGDLMANITCNEVGARLLTEFMEEYGIEDLKPLSRAIIDQSEKALREKIREMPDGTYSNRIQVEAIEEPVTLACRLEIKGDEILFDFSGTGDAVRAGINVPFCYTKAFAAYAVKCLTIPMIPNNEGSVRPIKCVAPEGCILNATPPSPTGGRHIIGHFVNPLVFGALATAVPDLVQADSGMLNLVNFQGKRPDGRGVSSIFFASGGFGALKGKDGAAAVPSPSNMTGTPIEVWENLTATTMIKKELLADSGGAGRYRGGLGQEIIIRNDSKNLCTISTLAGRTEFAPLGMAGGKPGGLRKYWVNEKEVHPKGRYVLKPGDRLRMVEAGGGGFGDPFARPPENVLDDVKEGLVSVDGALRDYGVRVNIERLMAERS